MNEKFILSEKLKLFLSVGSRFKHLTLGDRLPVSIRKHGSFTQDIIIYPESDYDFFTCSEIQCFLSLAKGLQLDSYVKVENGLPVIEITDYHVND